MIHSIFSVCCARDIKVWKTAAPYIIKNISAKNYYIIVPEGDLELFRQASPPDYVVLSENEFLPSGTSDLIKKFLPKDYEYRSGWYLQQLIKIAALDKLPAQPDDIILIWDADTIPLKKLNFYKDDRLLYFMGTENHAPYFNSIEKLLNISKSVNFSFIAQSFVFKKKWINEFIIELETLHKIPWVQSILEKSDLSHPSGFSEYETLGNWLMSKHKSEIAFNTASWERFGSSKCGLNGIEEFKLRQPSCHFISFESWDGYIGEKNLVQMSTLGRNGRFGNQIFQYFFLRLIEHELSFEIRFPQWLGNQLFCIPSSEELVGTTYPIDWGIAAQKTDTPELDLSRIKKLMDLNNTNSLDISGHFHHHTKHLKKYKKLFEETFTLDGHLVKQVQKRLHEIGSDQVIAIHVRAGDYIDLEKLNGGYGFTITPSFSEINKTVQDLLAMAGESRSLIYLASDDLDFSIQKLQSFGINCITCKDLFPNKSDFSDLFLDFCVLTLADYLLISNSSFSFSAAMLNKSGKSFFRPNVNNKKYQIFDPWDDHILHIRTRSLYI